MPLPYNIMTILPMPTLVQACHIIDDFVVLQL